jgi:hypothetical protein
VPLGADFTAPVAVMLAKENPKKRELARLLQPGKYAETAHIVRLQPYDPKQNCRGCDAWAGGFARDLDTDAQFVAR